MGGGALALCKQFSRSVLGCTLTPPTASLSLCGGDKQEFHCILIFAVRAMRNAQCNQIIINPIQSYTRYSNAGLNRIKINAMKDYGYNNSYYCTIVFPIFHWFILLELSRLIKMRCFWLRTVTQKSKGCVPLRRRLKWPSTSVVGHYINTCPTLVWGGGASLRSVGSVRALRLVLGRLSLGFNEHPRTPIYWDHHLSSKVLLVSARKVLDMHLLVFDPNTFFGFNYLVD